MKKSTPLKNQFLKISPYMPELLGFETMLIIHPYGMAVHARVVAGLVFSLLFKLVSSYCVCPQKSELKHQMFEIMI